MAKPRTIRGAIKRGWVTVRVPRQENLSYVGILNRISRLTTGTFINEYDMHGGGYVAFENPRDAVIVQLKFGHVE